VGAKARQVQDQRLGGACMSEDQLEQETLAWLADVG
jgi:hypothetical protein